MLFNSYEFMLVFLPLCLIAWWGLARWPNVRLTLMVAASYLFYGWWKWEFTALLAFSTILDWGVGLAIERAPTKQRKFSWLLVSLVGNLGVLAYFKYTGFFASAINDVLTALRSGASLPIPQIVLPVGISFYTFQTLTYSIDLYRGQVKSARSLLHFAAYVSMFPQLIAGPIVRYSDIEDQLRQLPRRIDWQNFATGIWFFIIGMSQKVLVADTLAKCCTPLLEDMSSLQFFSSWLALASYSGQLYFDFAGYSNMAVGLGWMMSLKFPQNFDSPYQATSIQDFWRRWHITLSSFLRDYLYFPLGGSRGGAWLTSRNLMLVMILGGLWHGAGWTFLLWGAWHGTWLTIHYWYRRTTNWKMPSSLAIPLTLSVVFIGWLIFRSTNLAMVGQWLSAMAGLHGFEAKLGLEVWSDVGSVFTFVVLCICLFSKNCWQYRPELNWKSSLVMASLMILCILRFDADSPFLYFQF
jgi:alginate O-acetyltransferase complex protein AlgI